MKDDFGSDYDVLLLFNIVHGFDTEGNCTLFERCLKALKSGGLLVIAEQLVGGGLSKTSNSAVELLGLAYMHLLNGRIYSFEELREMLQGVGYRDVERVNLLQSGSSLVLARRA